jgi:NADPH:quinone reductase-like Zn-dependent oxidoreductase
MKAIVAHRYGSPDTLKLEEVADPTPGDDEVLLRVHASSVSFVDTATVRGKPAAIRAATGLFAPRRPIPGADVAGRVVAAGANVTRFEPGDEVYADLSDDGLGGHAELVCVPERLLARKPARLSFVQAAAVPHAAVVALQGLRDVGRIEAGQRVLIVGASGGIGTFAVQLAKSFGAHVTGVCGPDNVELVRSLGADEVIDYTQQDFAAGEQRWDLIVAIAGYRWLLEYRDALTPQGAYVMIGGTMKQVFQAVLLGALFSKKRGKRLAALSAKSNADDLATVTELIDAGEIEPVVGRTWPLAQVAEAMTHYDGRHARGKVVIEIQA